MQEVLVLRGWEPAAQSCALGRSFYSRRAQNKSTAEANFFISGKWGNLMTDGTFPAFPDGKLGNFPSVPVSITSFAEHAGH